MNTNQITICDASVLINFLKIDRMDLFEKCSYSFFLTDHVHEEISIHYPKQRNLLDDSLSKNIFQKVNVENPQEFKIFAQLSASGQLGTGECAAIAVASYRGYKLAIDDSQAIKKAEALLNPAFILRTQDLVVVMIKEHLLEIEEADRLIQTWAVHHRFRLKIKSFSELLVQSRG